MIFPLFENMLNSRGVGYAFLTPDLAISNYNDHFKKLTGKHISGQENSIYNIVPETVGLEHIFKEIIAGKRSYFRLDNLNRGDAGEVLYFDLSLRARLLFLLLTVVFFVLMRYRLLERMTHVFEVQQQLLQVLHKR